MSRQQGEGQRYGFISVLVAREAIGKDTVDQSPPQIPASELPSRLASELVMAHTYGQECVDEFAGVWKHSMGVELGGLCIAWGLCGGSGRLWHVATKQLNVISAKRVYSWKVIEFGTLLRAKARLVARGFGQYAGVALFETFPPCPSVASVRFLAVIAFELGLHLCLFDTEQADSEVSEDACTRPPRGAPGDVR